MKFFVDLSKKQLIKSAASNVALERVVLKRRDSLAVEVVFVSRNAIATMPAGTTVSVALKKSFADSNFLASASGTPPILNLNTVPLEALFSASNPSAIPALLEIRWTVPGETTRTATLQAEIQNSVILGTEGSPEAVPDLKATQAEAQAGTNNEKWMTPLRTAQAIAVLAPPPTWDAVQNKPATFPPSAHTHAISEVTGLQSALDSKATTTALTAEATARTTALSTKADLVSGKVPATQLTTFTYGQPGIVPNSFGADAGKFLKGDGNWTLPTTSDVTGLDTALAGKQPSGSYATLVSGKVPADQLPSYVDDVLEFANLAALPVTGETGKIYVTTTAPSKAYRWTGSAYFEISASEVTSVAGKTGAVTLALEDLTNFSSLSGTAYKPASYSAEVTSNTNTSSDSYSAATQVRSQAWTITFRAARTIDFFLPATITVMGQVLSAPQLGDLYSAEILEGGPSFTGQWTARFKRPDGTIIHTVTRADSDLEKSSLRFVYDGSAWNLDRTAYHQHSYTDLLDTPEDVATGFFDRSTDAISRPPEQGQAPHQVVLANDTRLTNARRTAWVTPAPASPTNIASGLEPGAMSYDGSFLYTLVPMPGGQTMRWARTPMTTTW